jgi:hypothetical protein
MDGGRYDVTEFRNRHLTLPALDDDSVQPESLLSRSALQINATTKCIIEAHAILECFIGITTDTLQKAPNLLFVRAIYALVVLMKADYAVGTDPEMGEILDSQSLKVDFYLQTVLKKSSDAIGSQKCRMPSHWTFVLEQSGVAKAAISSAGKSRTKAPSTIAARGRRPYQQPGRTRARSRSPHNPRLIRTSKGISHNPNKPHHCQAQASTWPIPTHGHQAACRKARVSLLAIKRRLHQTWATSPLRFRTATCISGTTSTTTSAVGFRRVAVFTQIWVSGH